ELSGLPIANSSMYDGGTALAEAVNLSAAQTKRKKVIVSKAVHPESRAVIKTYAKGPELEIVEIDHKDGRTDLEQLAKVLDEHTAGVAIQYPNFFGQMVPLEAVKEIIEQQKDTVFIVPSKPLAVGYFTPRGQHRAGIVVGDTQVSGIPSQFGGPHCGYFTTTKKLMRKVPGRLAGRTSDDEGVRVFV